jgi:hypothetical protein
MRRIPDELTVTAISTHLHIRPHIGAEVAHMWVLMFIDRFTF